MKHKLLTVVMALVLVTTAFGGTALAQTGTPTDTPVGNETTQEEQVENNTTQEAPPGLQIAAMMGSIEREIGASMERFEMSRELRMAENDSERQAILDSYLDRQSAKADKARSEVENNSKNKSGVGQYKAAMGVVDARNAAQNAEFAQEQAEKFGVGVNKTKVEQLRQNANEMSGQEVSALARSLAGPPAHANAPDKAGPKDRCEVGDDDCNDGDDTRGPPAHAGDDDNESDDDVVYNVSNVSEQVDDARATFEEANASGNYSNETLAEAEKKLVKAEDSLAKAENASDEEGIQEALETAVEAVEEMNEVLDADSDDDGIEDAVEDDSDAPTTSSNETSTNASEQGA